MAFLKLIRYKNLLMVLLTMVLTKYALLHSFLTNSYLSNFNFIILIVAVLLITAGGYIVNDIFDIEADKINKPNKVFIDIFISKKNAWLSYYILTFSGLLFGIYISISTSLLYCSLVFIITAFSLFIYSKYLKQLLFIGNFLISSCVGLVIYIVYLFDFKYIQFWKLTQEELTNSLLFLNIWISVILYFLFAFLTTLIREIIKDVEDINGDLQLKAKTLPIVFGRKRAANVAFFFTCILLVFLLVILRFLQNDYLFLGYGIIFILLPLSYFMYKLCMAKSKKDFSNLSNLLKLIMLFGILSMLLFKF